MYDITNLNQPVGLERIDSNVRAQRTANYIRRMIPHVFGWFPMMAVWFILIVQLENAKRDIDEISDRNIPGWVESLIYGQFLIFTQFAFVRRTPSNLHRSCASSSYSSSSSDGINHSLPVLGRLKSSFSG